MKVLVTGGAGYIGSHVVRQLGEAGHDITVLDNLSTGRREAVLAGKLVVEDLANRPALESLFDSHRFDAVMHFAADIIVPESVVDPLKYYSNNSRNMLGLLECCDRFGIKKVIFSSTAAVYGIPETRLVTENYPLAPINPYGASKMFSERMLMDLAVASELRYVILRYFNVAGANLNTLIGESAPDPTHLITICCQAALGQREAMTLFGTDYPTADGTCIRDYIHVEDLARAHLSALEHLDSGNESEIFNCGYGHGVSVREVVEMVRKVSGVDFKAVDSERRLGDPQALIADSAKIRNLLDWKPMHDDLELIVRTALEWERKELGVPGP